MTTTPQPPLAPQPCLACSAATDPLYEGVGDYFFHSGFSADYRVCSDPRCRTIVQSPLPTPAELGRYYGTYYTHASLGPVARWQWRAEGRLEALLHRGLRAADGCTPAPLETLRSTNLLLNAAGVVPGGERPSALDVGCGNGASLVMLSAFGYAEAKGVETDERACEAARGLGFEVLPGTAEAIPYPDASFDLVFLRHVIEHVTDPVRAIRECLRVIKPGGFLSLLTPNAAARMHGRYRRYWRGLESPRHVHVFTPPSLARVVERCGATVVRAGANDRSSWWMSRMSRAGVRAAGGDPAREPPLFELAPELERGEEVFVIARVGR